MLMQELGPSTIFFVFCHVIMFVTASSASCRTSSTSSSSKKAHSNHKNVHSSGSSSTKDKRISTTHVPIKSPKSPFVQSPFSPSVTPKKTDTSNGSVLIIKSVYYYSV